MLSCTVYLWFIKKGTVVKYIVLLLMPQKHLTRFYIMVYQSIKFIISVAHCRLDFAINGMSEFGLQCATEIINLID